MKLLFLIGIVHIRHAHCAVVIWVAPREVRGLKPITPKHFEGRNHGLICNSRTRHKVSSREDVQLGGPALA